MVNIDILDTMFGRGIAMVNGCIQINFEVFEIIKIHRQLVQVLC